MPRETANVQFLDVVSLLISRNARKCFGCST
uniref:Uncharacterized protein n=1 Tax=Anguilla anguilla TaxID=7936 RepID=A0A0E9VJS3_ANGAN